MKCAAWMSPASESTAAPAAPSTRHGADVARRAPAPAPAPLAPVERGPEYSRVDYGKPESVPVPITTIDASSDHMRVSTGIEALDHVLGGGQVVGSIVLLGGNPGVGKSTLFIQWLSSLQFKTRLYITNEESVEQVTMRAQRVGAMSEQLLIARESNVHHIMTHAESTGADVFAVDSINTIVAPEIHGHVGGVVQVKACAKLLEDFCHTTGKTLIMISHVDKDGDIAGPNALQHLVDASFEFVKDPEMERFRILRSTAKNRFGDTSRSAMFEMTENGLVALPVVDAAEHDERRRKERGREPADALVPVAQELLDRYLDLGGKIDAGLADRIAGRLRTSPCD